MKNRTKKEKPLPSKTLDMFKKKRPILFGRLEENVLPSVLYRFFDEATHAESFIKGFVKVSTLETCRNYEDPEQGDNGEGIHIYHIEHYNPEIDIEHKMAFNARSPVIIGRNSKNCTVSNISRLIKIPDAYVLCTTHEFNPELFKEGFGKYCVRINDPLNFMKRVAQAMNDTYGIRACTHGYVDYSSRIINLHENDKPLGFVKPEDPYAPQKEFRFIWDPITLPIFPSILKCIDLSDLCERIL
ncbi:MULTISPECIES: hypothetical protein [Klebsiella]|uniref:hypothetical protein n=1 Tax=Klebsiella TaxID=570 RepID=UPI001BCFD810|nr:MULTISPECIES: hypothetical protein [Klebsiella]HBT6275676.1 hypothetical protein [Klebsiella quasipneumoniae]MCF2309200.1 hypothetical protein [Klebsiella quasipneumoniae subsp. similipneumoniae]HDE1083679.1 hypothetical protein [Klebsiella quasipneumoniae]HDE1500097.1 hypothetical protein [Klebsiella quasipneumoniae]HDE2018762.1 hypothetical protein [Klebsiella quasipneumoniae]